MRKKFLQGAATLSMAAAVCIMSGLVTASADTLPEDKVTVDYEKQQVIVDLSGSSATEPGGSETDEPTGQADGDEETEPVTPPATTTNTDQEILFNVASVNKNKELKASTWEVYDVGADKKVTIDITSLNTQKDNYVQIKGDVSKDPITLFIPATDKTLRLKFNAYSGLAEFNKGADASKTADYEYRTEYSDWSDAAKLDQISLKMYQERGAKLYFRLSKSADSATVGGVGTEVKDIKDKANNGETLANVYKMPSLPGKEIKVSVGKKANAPKATVIYKKGTDTIPNGAKYRINGKNADGVYQVGLIDWSAPTSGKVTLDSKSTGDAKTAYDALVAGGSVEVKKCGNEGKKKAESKIFQLAFPNAQDTLTGESTTANVKDNPITDPDDGKTVTASITENKDSKQATTSFKLTVTNNTGYNYEVVVSKDKPAADAKSTVVKANGKSATINKISKDGSSVWIRRSADQKKAEWATEYIQMGVIPAAATTPDTPGTGDEEVTVTEADLQAFAAEYIANPVILKTSGVGQGDGVDIAATGKDFTWASKDYEVTVNDVKKTLKGVTVTVKSVSNNALLPALDEADISDGLKYGSGYANIGLMTDQNAPSVVLTVKCGDISYDHNLTFSK